MLIDSCNNLRKETSIFSSRGLTSAHPVPEEDSGDLAVPSVAGPLPSFLLLHGGKDPLIPAKGCRNFEEALRTRGADADVRIDPESGHWHRDAFQLVPAFFRRTLGPLQLF